jgi:hypothetical protein
MNFPSSAEVCLCDFKMLDEVNPPTKVVGKFLRAWVDRGRATQQCLKTTLIPMAGEVQDPAGIALSLSRRLIAVVKLRNILNIEAGLEMIALAMMISSEV